MGFDFCDSSNCFGFVPNDLISEMTLGGLEDSENVVNDGCVEHVEMLDEYFRGRLLVCDVCVKDKFVSNWSIKFRMSQIISLFVFKSTVLP